jgi:hypothetical protein
VETHEVTTANAEICITDTTSVQYLNRYSNLVCNLYRGYYKKMYYSILFDTVPVKWRYRMNKSCRYFYPSIILLSLLNSLLKTNNAARIARSFAKKYFAVARDKSSIHPIIKYNKIKRLPSRVEMPRCVANIKHLTLGWEKHKRGAGALFLFGTLFPIYAETLTKGVYAYIYLSWNYPSIGGAESRLVSQRRP